MRDTQCQRRRQSRLILMPDTRCRQSRKSPPIRTRDTTWLPQDRCSRIRHQRTAIHSSICRRCRRWRSLMTQESACATTAARCLTYADLKSTFDDPDGREPGRTIELHLTGHMERFAWSFDGIKFSSAEPIRLTYGERLRIVLVNDTMMSHPIHLHGMWSDLEDEQGAIPGSQAHHRYATRHEARLPRPRRRIGTLGVSLPSAVPYGIGHVPGSAGRRMIRTGILIASDRLFGASRLCSGNAA